MKNLLVILPVCLFAGATLAGIMPISNGRLESNLDGGGYTITNATFAGTIVLDTSTPIVATSWAEAPATTNVDLNYHDIDHVETLDANRVEASSVVAPDISVDRITSHSMYDIYIGDTLQADGHAITGASLVQASAYYGDAGALTGFGGVVSGVASNLAWAAGSIGANELDIGELQTVFLTSVGTARFDNAVIADLSRVTTNYISNSTFPSNAAGWALGGDAYWAADGRIQVLEANSGTLTLSNFNAVAGKAYKLKFKKGTTYSSISVSLGNITKTVNPDLVGDITDYYYCTATGALTFAMSVGSIPDIFQYLDNIELYAITSGTMQVVGDLFVHGTLHADGIEGDGTPIDSRSATNNVNMGGHTISNVTKVMSGTNDLFISPNEEWDGPYGTTPFPDLLLQAGCSPDDPGDLCLRSFGNIRVMFEDSSSESMCFIVDIPNRDSGVSGSLWRESTGIVCMSGRETGTYYSASTNGYVGFSAGTNLSVGGASIQLTGNGYSGDSLFYPTPKGSVVITANTKHSSTGGYDGSIILGHYNNDGISESINIKRDGVVVHPHLIAYGGTSLDDEYVRMPYLPTSDPNELGRLWRSGSNVYISTGP